MAERLARREVAESGLEFLLVELVDRFARVLEPADLAEDGLRADAALEARGRVEAMGYDVGMRVVERMAMEKERLETDLEVIKYICKDFWEQVFKKQVDVLKTNHKGLFVLQDNNFRWLRFVSECGKPAANGASPEDYAVFPCGLICGALQRLGIACTVTVDASKSPKAMFNVQIKQIDG